MPRLFVALLVPEAIRQELASLGAPLTGARWSPAENLHLTMRFIGEAESARETAFAEALARVRVEPFILEAAGVGVFPTRGPAKALWAGFGTAHPRLFQLRKQIDEALLSVDPGLDVGIFHPHVTLARLERDYDPKALARFVETHAEFDAGPFRVNEFHLMASELGAGRPPTDRRVQAFPLGG